MSKKALTLFQGQGQAQMATDAKNSSGTKEMGQFRGFGGKRNTGFGRGGMNLAKTIGLKRTIDSRQTTTFDHHLLDGTEIKPVQEEWIQKLHHSMKENQVLRHHCASFH